MEEEERGKDVREYLAMLRRRKGEILAVTAVLAAVAIAVAIGLPSVYRSSATILVQEQEVPPDLVRSTITSFADERIQAISQQVMTRAVLLQLIDKYQLYEKYRARATTEEILERMRKDIKLSFIDANISGRTSGRRVNATIAFQISYESPHPERAQKVVNDLALLYLNENVKARQQSVAETTAFLAQEADRVVKQMQEIEGNLVEFKRRYVGRMPESSAVNMQLAERTESELLRIDRETTMLQDRKLSLEAQLQLVKPNMPTAPPAINTAGERIVTPEDRLRTLQAQYNSAAALYTDAHPDIKRMQRELADLKAEVAATVKAGIPPGKEGAALVKEGAAAGKLKALEAQLAGLKDIYPDDHPDIQRLRRSITASKTAEYKETAVPKSADKRLVIDPTQKPDNPLYVALTSQLESTTREIVQLAVLKNDLRAKQRTYDTRLLQIPEIEREFRDLTRDYENAQTRYREVKAKQMQAEVSQELEKDSKAERFSLSEPANLPETPSSPARLRIALIGLIASLGGGLGLAWLREAFDPSIKGPLELARIAPVPILTAIPYIETQRERLGKRRRALMVASVVLLLGIAYLYSVHLFLKPLSGVWEGVMRRIVF